MARKVGFIEPAHTDRNKSVADSYLDEFRAKGRAEKEREQAKSRKVRKRQWFPIIFLMVWLTGWSTGIFLAFSAVLSRGGDESLWIWITIACFAWAGAFTALVWLLKGDVVDAEDHR